MAKSNVGARLVEVAFCYQTDPDPADRAFTQFSIRSFLREGELTTVVGITGEGTIEAVEPALLEIILGVLKSLEGRFDSKEFGESVEGP